MYMRIEVFLVILSCHFVACKCALNDTFSSMQVLTLSVIVVIVLLASFVVCYKLCDYSGESETKTLY